MTEPDWRPELVAASDLKPGPIRHETLPEGFVVRVRLVHGVIGDVVGTPLAEMVEGFKRDLDPVSELRTWERIALVISDLSRAHVVTQQQMASILSTLLFASTGAPASELFGKAEGSRLSCVKRPQRRPSSRLTQRDGDG